MVWERFQAAPGYGFTSNFLKLSCSSRRCSVKSNAPLPPPLLDEQAKRADDHSEKGVGRDVPADFPGINRLLEMAKQLLAMAMHHPAQQLRDFRGALEQLLHKHHAGQVGGRKHQLRPPGHEILHRCPATQGVIRRLQISLKTHHQRLQDLPLAGEMGIERGLTSDATAC